MLRKYYNEECPENNGSNSFFKCLFYNRFLKLKKKKIRVNLGEGNGNPLQYSCLENPTDRGAWWATVHGVTKELDMT